MAEVDGNIEKDFLGFLPELNEVCANFIELSRQLCTTKKSYANILLSDPTLSTRIFSFINLVLKQNVGSSGYVSINKGISLMGLHEFKNIVMAFSLFPSFQEANCVDLFKFSLSSALYSRDIASQFNFINEHDAFLLGFLHDIGKLALKNKFGEKYVISSFGQEEFIEEPTIEDEIQQFSYSHSELSEYICRSWNLPVVVCDSIRFHHYPLDAMLPQASSIIFLSDMLAHKATIQQGIVQRVLQYLQLSKSDLVPYMKGADRKLIPFFEILGI